MMRRLPVTVLIFAALAVPLYAQVEVDSFGKLPDDDVYFRVEHFGTEVKRVPGGKGQAVIHIGKDQPLGAFLRYVRGIEDLWQRQGNPKDALVIHAGLEKPTLEHHFWIVKTGENCHADGFSLDERIRQKLFARTLFDSQCIGCSPAVLLHQWIFREGLSYYGQALQANKGSTAEIAIGRNEFVSGTPRERTKLTRDIRHTLNSQFSIAKRRIKIRFVRSMYARFYIIPNK